MSTAYPAAHPKPEPTTPRVRFSQFEVDLRARELYREGRQVPLQDRPFEVLTALLERPGEVVLRQELCDRLWPGQIVEFDNNLNTAVTKLRRALDDTSDDPTLIETLPKRGYRLLVPVESRVEVDVPAEAESEVRPPMSPALGALIATLVVAVAFLATTNLRKGPLAVESLESNVPAPVRSSRLVVLPFQPLDGTAGSERLADILTEELINRLAELLPAEVGVIARTSSMRFRGGESDVAEIRQVLNIDYVLEGSVSRDESGLQVRARFIHAADQAHLWAESYDSALTELPRIQRSLAERIATAISVHLRSTGSLDAAPVPREAWEAYVQARFLLSGPPAPSDEEITEAIHHLERAAELAPDFARAWAALADAVYRQSGPAPERHARSREAAEKALALDPALSLPHHRLANLALYQEWDWDEAGREFDWAISLAPSLALNHHSRAAWFSSQGRHEEALESIDRALALDPLSVVLHADAGWYLYVARRYEDAVERCRQALELVPDHRGANSYLFHSLVALGRMAEAGDTARTLLEIEGADPAALEHASGSAETAIETLHRHRLAVLETDHRQGTASPARLALAHMALDNRDEALTFLEEGLAQRWGWIYPFLGVYPLLDPLTDEPRFREMVREVGAPLVPRS